MAQKINQKDLPLNTNNRMELLVSLEMKQKNMMLL